MAIVAPRPAGPPVLLRFTARVAEIPASCVPQAVDGDAARVTVACEGEAALAVNESGGFARG